MRKRTVLWQLFVLLFITAEIHAQEFPSKWYFGKEYHQKVKESWCSEGTMKPSEYGDALLKARKADGSLPDSCTFFRYRPMAGPMAAGDCIVMEFPQSHLPAGSYVEFDLTFAAEKALLRFGCLSGMMTANGIAVALIMSTVRHFIEKFINIHPCLKP